jgi:hypothetical protein
MILATQWIFFMSSVNHDFGGGLVQSFKGSEGIWKGESYMKLAEMKEEDMKLAKVKKKIFFFFLFFLGKWGEEAKFSCLLLVTM